MKYVSAAVFRDFIHIMTFPERIKSCKVMTKQFVPVWLRTVEVVFLLKMHVCSLCTTTAGPQTNTKKPWYSSVWIPPRVPSCGVFWVCSLEFPVLFWRFSAYGLSGSALPLFLSCLLWLASCVSPVPCVFPFVSVTSSCFTVRFASGSPVFLCLSDFDPHLPNDQWVSFFFK